MVDELEALYRARLPESGASRRRSAGDRDAGRDAVQEAFALAIRKRRSFRGDGSLEAWVWSDRRQRGASGSEARRTSRAGVGGRSVAERPRVARPARRAERAAAPRSSFSATTPSSIRDDRRGAWDQPGHSRRDPHRGPRTAAAGTAGGARMNVLDTYIAPFEGEPEDWDDVLRRARRRVPRRRLVLAAAVALAVLVVGPALGVLLARGTGLRLPGGAVRDRAVVALDPRTGGMLIERRRGAATTASASFSSTALPGAGIARPMGPSC